MHRPEKINIVISKDHYAPSVKNGREFTSIDYSCSRYGGAYPCDSEEEVQRGIGWAKKSIRNEGDIPIVIDKREIKKLEVFF